MEEIRKNEELEAELNDEDASEEELSKLAGGKIVGCIDMPLILKQPVTNPTGND